jgi:hypothetical protein
LKEWRNTGIALHAAPLVLECLRRQPPSCAGVFAGLEAAEAAAVEREDFEVAADLSAQSEAVRGDIQAAEQQVQAAERVMQAAVSTTDQKPPAC